MMDIHKEAFREEARELLAELEQALLELEEIPEDLETVGRVFRALHTIKGSGAMFGFDEIAAFTHEVENTFDQVRNGKTVVTKRLIDLTLAAGDVIRRMLSATEAGSQCSAEERAEMEEAAAEIIRHVKDLIPPDSEDADAPAAQSAPSGKKQDVSLSTYRIFLRPGQDAFHRGMNPLLLLDELRGVGECTTLASLDAVPEGDDYDPEACYAAWDIILSTTEDINAIRDVFIFVEDECELRIDKIDECELQPEIGEDLSDAPQKKLGEILIERGDISPDKLKVVLGEQKRIGELLVDAGLVEPVQVESALAEQRHLREVREKRREHETASSVRVPAAKLDKLVDLVGELVTVQARLSQMVALSGDPALVPIAEEVERLTAELRDNTMSIRMLPIGSSFNKFKRLVRDLCNELGKEVNLVTEGEETELDKTVIERLNDPLVHIIRNCMDHGIEDPETRERLGKPRKGLVHLSALHSGANVLIRISDDGKGLDPESIRAKAIEKGLMAPDADLSEKDIFAFIFAPGFSTAREVTNLSGRGVGMDVVKRCIENLRGTIELNSRKGFGTEITLKLPLTLAIIDGLLVKIAEDHYVLPLSIVEECVELSHEEVARANGRHVIGLRGEIVPYIRLRDRFGINGTTPEIEQIVVTESPGGRIGFVVDCVVGEHQTVIKNLSRVYREVESVSGATILGDGTIALVLDAGRLIRDVEAEEQN